MRCMRLAGIVVAISGAFAAQVPAQMQTPSSNARMESGNSSAASCYDESGRLVGSTKNRTWEVRSPDGNYRAYAGTVAIVHKVKNANGVEYVECKNTSRLFVAGLKSQKFRQVLTLRPSQYLFANSIQLVDWSANKHRLLIAQGLSQYGSDFGGTLTQIYDADSGTLSSPNFVDQAFRKHVGKHCVGNFQPVGFSSNGAVIVSASPYFDEGEDHLRADSCDTKGHMWLIDRSGRTISELADNLQVPRYRKWSKTKSSNLALDDLL